MSDLISREEAIKVVDDLKITIEPDVIEEYTLYQVLAILVKKIESNLVDRINRIPTIEAVPVERNKVIDEFAERCKADIMCQTFGLHPINIDKIAERMKGGENQ